MAEYDDFAPRATFVEGLPDPDTVLLRAADGRLRVELVHPPYFRPRNRRRPPAVWLDPGEWVRWQANYLLVGSSTGEWSYRLHTLNLSHGPAQVNLFTGTPSRQVDERTHLR
jgi:hypothetical protein